MKRIYLILIAAIAFFSSSCKKTSGTCDCANVQTLTLKYHEIMCMALNCTPFTAFDQQGNVVEIQNLHLFKLEPKDQTIEVCFNDNLGAPGLYAACINGMQPAEFPKCGCECDNPDLVVCKWNGSNSGNNNDIFELYDVNGNRMYYNNINDFDIPFQTQKLKICSYTNVDKTFDIAYMPTINCIEGIGYKKPTCEGDKNPCGNMMKGRTVTKETVGGACGDFYIQDEKGMYLFPLNIDKFPEMKFEGATFEFSYDHLADPCNSAPGINIKCVVMTSAVK